MNNFIHIISVGVNGGENIIQKYSNYIKVYQEFNCTYKLIIIAPNGVKNMILDDNILYIKVRASSDKCQLKRLWINAMNELENTINKLIYNYLLLRIDYVDKNILNFIKKYQPILEYPTPPIEKTLYGKSLYQLLSKKYNAIALTESKLNLTIIKVGYPNSYLFHNSLVDQHTKKTDFKLVNNTIRVLMMSSKYGTHEYNGYDRFLNGLTNYYKEKDIYKFEIYVAGRDEEGFKTILDTKLNPNITIHYLGFKSIKELNLLINKIDIGINDLAFHRKGLHSANTLKTIDFIGWNLPFIVSHSDVNLNINHSFYLKEEENDSPINIERMIHFLKNIQMKSITEMRWQAEKITLQKRVNNFLLYLKETNV